jgi:hypothetical protein
VDFVKSDVSLLKSVDAACEEISKKEDKVNILFMTPGVLTMQGRTGMNPVGLLGMLHIQC